MRDFLVALSVIQCSMNDGGAGLSSGSVGYLTLRSFPSYLRGREGIGLHGLDVQIIPSASRAENCNVLIHPSVLS